MELEQKQHSSGVAKAGLTTGIIGSSLGALNLLGGLPFAMNRNFQNGVCNGDCENSRTVTKYELDQSQEISRLKSELALKDANIYGDQKMLELYRYIDSKFIEFEKQFAAQAVTEQANRDSFSMVNERLTCLKTELCGALDNERHERRCSDDIIVTYANSTFYPKQVADVTTGTATTAQTLYNPLPSQTCGRSCCR